jgi:hypothetical protein
MNFRSKFAQLAFKAAIFSLFVFFYSCRTAEVAVNNDLKSNSEVYAVKGRQGFQVGQVLSFGDFTTSKVKRGWTFSYSVPFIVKFQGAKEKLSFQQFDQNKNVADVAVVSRFKETEYTPVGDYFDISLRYKNYFAGTLKMNGAEDTWDFIIHNVDGNERSLGKNGTAGFIRNRQTKIDIVGIRELEGASSFLTQNDVYGYEFRQNGQIIGSVSTINNGKVWFKNGLNEDLKLVLAGVSSSLMLRNNVENEVVSLN